MARRKITEKQLRALARGRKKALANRRAKKKTGVKAHPRTTRKKAPMRRNPTGIYHDLGLLSTIKLAAPNSTSGNPRRLFLTFRRGQLMAIFDEEYDGDMALPQKLRRTYLGHTYKISPGEYNRLNKIRKVWETTESGKGIMENPAYGNFLNAIAAKERGGLGRAAYQNPVRPLQKKPAGDYMVMRGARYWTGYSFSEKRALSARYGTVKAATAMAQKLATKTNTPVKVVLAARHLK